MTTQTSPPAPAPLTASGAFPRWMRRVFLANLVGQVLIVVSGGVVRLTGSGLGCPTWPECVPGSFVPVAHQEEQFHKYIEFGNRAFAVAVAVLAVLALLAAFWYVRDRRQEDRHIRWAVVGLAAVPLAGTVPQAVIGGITVLTGLNPVIVAAHFLVSFLIIAGCVVLVVRSAEPGDQPVSRVVRPELRWVAWAAVALAALVVVLGTVVTGSGPHSGGAGSVRFGLDPRTVAWLHADVVILYLGVLVALALALRLTDAPRRPRRAVLITLAVALSQGLVGYLQYFTGLPWLLVAVHLLGAALVWVSVWYLLLTTRTRGVPAAI